MFGVADLHGTVQGLATIPEFIWELGLGIYATVWGFRRTAVLARYERDAGAKGAPA
jgi:hypothetical protein